MIYGKPYRGDTVKDLLDDIETDIEHIQNYGEFLYDRKEILIWIRRIKIKLGFDVKLWPEEENE